MRARRHRIVFDQLDARLLLDGGGGGAAGGGSGVVALYAQTNTASSSITDPGLDGGDGGDSGSDGSTITNPNILE